MQLVGGIQICWRFGKMPEVSEEECQMCKVIPDGGSTFKGRINHWRGTKVNVKQQGINRSGFAVVQQWILVFKSRVIQFKKWISLFMSTGFCKLQCSNSSTQQFWYYCFGIFQSPSTLKKFRSIHWEGTKVNIKQVVNRSGNVNAIGWRLLSTLHPPSLLSDFRE